MVKNLFAIGCCTATKKKFFVLFLQFVIFNSENQQPFCDRKKLNPRIPEHVNSNEHQRYYSDWNTLEKNLKEGKTMCMICRRLSVERHLKSNC